MKGFGGMQQLMRQANQIQSKMKKKQEELSAQIWDGTSGGGAVKVSVNGEYQLTKVEIDPEVLSDSDHEMLEDLILTAANDALKTAKTTCDEEIAKITGGMGMPGF